MPGGPEYSKPNQEWRAPPKPHSESEANPLAPLLREQQGGEGRSYEELVSIIRTDIERERARLRNFVSNPDSVFDPVLWMRDRIISADTERSIAENRPPSAGLGATVYAKFIMAWDIISSPYIKPKYYVSKSNAERGIKDRAKILGSTITLDPNESRLLSAMAEAVGIPNPFGPVTPEKQEPK